VYILSADGDRIGRAILGKYPELETSSKGADGKPVSIATAMLQALP